MFLQRFLIPIAVTIDMSFAADNVRGIRRVVSDTAEPTNIDDNMSMIAAVFEEEPENEMFSDATADEDPVIDTNTAEPSSVLKPAADGSSVIEELISSIVGATDTDAYIQTLKGYLAPSSASVVPTTETMSKGGKTVSSGDDAVVMSKSGKTESVFSKSTKSKSSKTSEPTMFRKYIMCYMSVLQNNIFCLTPFHLTLYHQLPYLQLCSQHWLQHCFRRGRRGRARAASLEDQVMGQERVASQEPMTLRCSVSLSCVYISASK